MVKFLIFFCVDDLFMQINRDCPQLIERNIAKHSYFVYLKHSEMLSFANL